jgi:hypothetical protein
MNKTVIPWCQSCKHFDICEAAHLLARAALMIHSAKYGTSQREEALYVALGKRCSHWEEADWAKHARQHGE